MATIFHSRPPAYRVASQIKSEISREDDESARKSGAACGGVRKRKGGSDNTEMKSGLTPRQQLVQGIARKEGIADDHLPEEPKKSARKLVLKKESLLRARRGAPLMDRTGAGKRAAAAAAAEWRWR